MITMIKSQKAVKDENVAKANKPPQSMVDKFSRPKTDVQEEQHQLTLDERVAQLEKLAVVVDQNFGIIATEFEKTKHIIASIQYHDDEISKIIGDIVKISKFNEELAHAINQLNEKLTIMDEALPNYIDQKFNDYLYAEDGDEYADDNAVTPDNATNENEEKSESGPKKPEDLFEDS